MNDVIFFSLIVVTIIRLMGVGISIDFYLKSRNSWFILYGYGWFLWAIGGILPLFNLLVAIHIVNDLLYFYNALLSTIALLLLFWGLIVTFVDFSKKWVIGLIISILIVAHILFFNVQIELTVSIISVIQFLVMGSIVVIPLIKLTDFRNSFNRELRINYIIIMILALLYYPIAFLMLSNGEMYGLYDSSNVLLIFLNYGYLLIITILLNILSLHLEYRILFTTKLELKDKFSHNLGNVLQSIYSCVDLLNSKDMDHNELESIRKLLTEKRNEASKLIDEIRGL